MVIDVERIKADIEALKNLTAEEYCREKVQLLYQEFEASRQNKIADLTKTLEVVQQYEQHDNVEAVTEPEYVQEVEGE